MKASLFDLFARPIVCQSALRIAASAERTWALVGDIGDVSLAKDFVDRIEVTGQGEGAIRHLYLKGGAVVTERIEEYSVADHYYVYRVIDQGPTSFTHHLAVTKVTPAGPDACILSWITTAMAVTGHEDEVRAILQANIDMVLTRVRGLLERQSR